MVDRIESDPDLKNHAKTNKTWLVVEPTHPEKYAQVKLDHETPKFGVKIKKN